VRRDRVKRERLDHTTDQRPEGVELGQTGATSTVENAVAIS